MVGLPCSGKTTYARQLAEETGAFVFTPDVWQIRILGQTACSPYHDKWHTAIEGIMWELAEKLLRRGFDVILDFGFWAREERDDFRGRARRLGAGFRIHYMDVAANELYRRLEERNKRPHDAAFIIQRSAMDKYMQAFQPPTADELV